MLMILVSALVFSQQTVTVTANSEDISAGLDLTIVANLFAEAQNIEDFELILNNPDSMFCNLDLNRDGNVDYIRVIEVGEGNKRLIVLQALLGPDIYQDIASIYVEKEESKVTVQIIGDEYVYGTNYIIEPTYIYYPRIYRWLWSPAWHCWYSPWYWDYYPRWWYVHHCWFYDRYYMHCHHYHRHHYCSFHRGHQPRPHYHDMHHPVHHSDYAERHPNSSFQHRNTGITNAHELTRNGSGVSNRRPSGDRTYQSNHTAVRNHDRNSTVTRQPRPQGQPSQRTTSSSSSTRSSSTQQRTSSTSTQRTSPTQRSQSSSTSTTRSSSSTHSSQPSRSSSSYSGGSRSSGSVSRSSGASPSRSSGSSSRSGSGSSSRRR